MKGVFIMKKPMVSGIAVAAALTLALSSAPVFAAPSVSGNSAAVSGNSTAASEEKVLTDEEREEIRVHNVLQEFVSKASSYILGRPGTAVAKAQSGYVTVKTASGKVSVTPDYSEVTDKDVVVSVSAPKKDQAGQVLTDYVKLAAPNASKVLGPVKFQMFKSGKSVWDDFGSFTGKISVDKSFNGKTASVYQLHKDGTVTKTDVVIEKGAITITLTDMGSVVVALQ